MKFFDAVFYIKESFQDFLQYIHYTTSIIIPLLCSSKMLLWKFCKTLDITEKGGGLNIRENVSFLEKNLKMEKDKKLRQGDNQ